MLVSTASAGSAATSTAPLLASGADIEVVAANDLGDDKTMAHLLKYDTILGRFGQPVTSSTTGSRSATS